MHVCELWRETHTDMRVTLGFSDMCPTEWKFISSVGLTPAFSGRVSIHARFIRFAFH